MPGIIGSGFYRDKARPTLRAGDAAKPGIVKGGWKRSRAAIARWNVLSWTCRIPAPSWCRPTSRNARTSWCWSRRSVSSAIARSRGERAVFVGVRYVW